MLIDFIPVSKLPYFIVWLDWCFYAYRTSFFVLQLLLIAHYLYAAPFYTFATLSISVLIGTASWAVVCFFRQGYAVG